MKFIPALAAGLLIAAQAVPAAAEPFVGFLKIDGVKGDSVEPGHKKWIKVLGISQLPAGCTGDEGGGILSVRVAKLPDPRNLPGYGDFQRSDMTLDVVDLDGSPLRIVLGSARVGTTFSGPSARPIKIGLVDEQTAAGDGTGVMTFTFNRVAWQRASCERRTVASR